MGRGSWGWWVSPRPVVQARSFNTNHNVACSRRSNRVGRGSTSVRPSSQWSSRLAALTTAPWELTKT
eukprot:1319934-Prymnesium_polylepis.1